MDKLRRFLEVCKGKENILHMTGPDFHPVQTVPQLRTLRRMVERVSACAWGSAERAPCGECPSCRATEELEALLDE